MTSECVCVRAHYHHEIFVRAAASRDAQVRTNDDTTFDLWTFRTTMPPDRAVDTLTQYHVI